MYELKCHVCHKGGIVGSPKFGDQAAWTPRIAKGKDALYASVLNGLGSMPPRGTATDASDAEIKAAVDYMVASAK